MGISTVIGPCRDGVDDLNGDGKKRNDRKGAIKCDGCCQKAAISALPNLKGATKATQVDERLKFQDFGSIRQGLVLISIAVIKHRVAARFIWIQYMKIINLTLNKVLN